MKKKGTAQQRAIDKYRRRLKSLGLARFEVLGLESDCELVRSLARKLAERSPESQRIRDVLASASRNMKAGGILDALRRSPLVGADLKIERLAAHPREVDL